MGGTQRGIIAFLILLSSRATLAQIAPLPPIDQRPPAIEFTPWKEIPADSEDTSEYAASFPSSIESRYRENNVVPLRIILPIAHDKPVPVVIVLHYWGASDLRVERELAGELNDRGIGAVLITLPYHLSRTPPGTRSGQLAIQPEVPRLIETMTQAVLDVRRTIDFLDTRPEIDHNRIGIAGTSLGSLISILAFAVDPRISSAAFVLGGVDLAHIIWHSSRVVELRDALRRRGYTEMRLRNEIASIEPTRFLTGKKLGTAFV